jgi:hypothetical protein
MPKGRIRQKMIRMKGLPALIAAILPLALGTCGTAQAVTATITGEPSAYQSTTIAQALRNNPAPRAAPQSGKNFKVTYNKSWTFKSRALQICVVFSVRGNFTYHVSRSAEGRLPVPVLIWSNQRVNNPTLEADIHAYSGGTCAGPAAATGMSMGQHWTGHSCSFNPSLSVSYPFGVSLGFWPSCNNRNRANRNSSSSANSGFYEQFNTGDRVRVGNYSAPVVPGQKVKPPCYGVYVSGKVHEQMRNDADVSSAKEVCLNKFKL